MNSRVIAHIDMDAFFAAVEQRDNPSLIGKPVIIGADPKGGNGRGVVSTCSYEARRYGVHSAMPISVAYRKCPHAIFLPGNMRKYKEVSHQIFDILYEFTPDLEPVSVDEAFMDITGSYHLHNTALNTCRVIKEKIRSEVGLTASIGIAPTKMVAKIASDYSKPDGLLEITGDHLLEFLWPLPIERLWGVGRQTQKILNQMGAKTIGELAQFSIEDLQGALGSHGSHLHELANGIDGREVHVDEEIKSVGHEHTFDVDVGDRTVIYRILSYLSEKVSRRLRRYGLKGRTLTLKVRLSNFKTVTRNYTFPQRLNFYDEINTQACALFDEYYKTPMRIRLVGVRMTQFEDLYVQDGLFRDTVAQRKEQIHKVMDQIKDKYGEKSIRRAQNI